jgi:hypothetical protein
VAADFGRLVLRVIGGALRVVGGGLVRVSGLGVIGVIGGGLVRVTVNVHVPAIVVVVEGRDVKNCKTNFMFCYNRTQSYVDFSPL